MVLLFLESPKRRSLPAQISVRIMPHEICTTKEIFAAAADIPSFQQAAFAAFGPASSRIKSGTAAADRPSIPHRGGARKKRKPFSGRGGGSSTFVPNLGAQ